MKTIVKYKLIIVLLIGYQFSMAQDFNINDTDTIPFTLTGHNNISIQAIMNTVDTVDLMFHTAANSVTLTTTASEHLKNIKWSSKTDVNSWGGNSSARYSDSNHLEIDGLKWKDIPVWETTNSGPGTDGKFGPNLFKDYVIEINFDQGVLILYKTLPEKTKDFVKTTLEFKDGFMFIEGLSNINDIDYKNKFLIHSGYGGTVLFDDKFVAESKLGEHIEIIDEKELKDSYGNVLKTKKGKLPLFSIADIGFEYIPVGFFEGTIGRQQMSVIGGDLLKRFNLIIDSNREFIYLKANTLSTTSYAKI